MPDIDNRPAQLSDLDWIVPLDHEVNPSPWRVGHWHDALQGSPRYHFRVFYAGQIPVGFWVATLLFEEAELLNIAVAPTLQRQGFGRHLLQAMHATLSALGGEHCLLEVRASNRAAIALYESLDYHTYSTRLNYYPLPDGSREDAWLMRHELGAS